MGTFLVGGALGLLVFVIWGIVTGRLKRGHGGG